jgi:hypothetical protein
LLPTQIWSYSTGSIEERRAIRLPAGLPPGNFRLELGLYDANGQPQNLIGPDGNPVPAASFPLVVAPGGALPFTQARLDSLPGWGGANLVPRDGKIVAGQPVEALLIGTGGSGAPARLQLLTGGGQTAALSPPVPAGLRALASVSDTSRLRGDFQVYASAGGEALLIGAVSIASPAPEAEAPSAPAGMIGTTAQFGGGLSLEGYRRQEGQLQLIWHPTQPLPANLKSFVHVLNDKGEVIAQDDSVPARGKLPTTSWVPNSYVIDGHPLPNPLPSGAASIEVGLYDASSGVRWPVVSGGDVAQARVRLPAA